MLETEKLLKIDIERRAIIVPDTVLHLGVSADDSVHRLHFCMPRHYGEFDLSEFTIKVNFANAAGAGDIYRVEDANTTENYIKFSWLVGRTATAAAGKTRFSVCLKKYDEAGMVLQEFNTTYATLEVLQGLETTELVIQQNPDVLEELRIALGNIDAALDSIIAIQEELIGGAAT